MEKPDLTEIKNIIFDFGNVLLNINPRLTQEAFSTIGIKPGVDFWGSRSSAELLLNLEKGLISPEDFRKGALEMLVEGTTNEEVDKAWNALLLDLPSKRVELVKRLAQKYRIFLLSNSNQIHYDFYIHEFESKFGFPFSTLFEKTWFSHNLGMVKPDPEIFKFVLKDASLQPKETLFIDDTPMHVEAARKLQINAWHLEAGTEVCDLFS